MDRSDGARPWPLHPAGAPRTTTFQDLADLDVARVLLLALSIPTESVGDDAFK
ncbi:MAG: hypothetical protein U5R31_00255 [Acidimicrobiia bacterium]|nr:hypothetical protein [Acidimicrobiia bacterium]